MTCDATECDRSHGEEFREDKGLVREVVIGAGV